MSANVGKIEANQSWNGRTTTLSRTAVVTPSADGLYRISVYLSGSGTGSVAPNVFFTDDSGSEAISPAAASSSSPTSVTYFVKAKSSASIDIQATVSGTFTYDLYVEVEAL